VIIAGLLSGLTQLAIHSATHIGAIGPFKSALLHPPAGRHRVDHQHGAGGPRICAGSEARASSEWPVCSLRMDRRPVAVAGVAVSRP